MAGGDIYKLVTTYQFLGEEMSNVWHYRQTDGPGGVFELFEGFNASVLPDVLDIQSVGVEWLTADIINYDNPGDFGSFSYPGTTLGTRAGEAQPPFVCWAFRLNRTSRVTRNGQKRIGGVSEADVQNGVASSGVLTPLDNAAIVMGTIIDGGFNAWEPVIVRLTETAPIEPAVVNSISEGVYVRVSTQNSRKF